METQIRQIAGKYLHDVREAGEDDLRATCPFCGHSRTFMISLRVGAWICFSCSERGGVSWLLRNLGLTDKQIDRFMNSIQAYLPDVSPRGRADRRKEQVILPEYTLAAYRTCPLSLLEVGFKEETLFKHDVGYDAGHDRITFAIRDLIGRLVAISGRACESWMIPKYKVYDADPKRGGELCGVVDNYIPNNRDHLYGFDSVHPERWRGRVHPPFILVEGYKGCLWVRQHGYEHTTALMGYSLSASQKRLAGSVKGPYYVWHDHEPGKNYPDEKGNCTAYKVAMQLSTFGRTFICIYPEGSPIGTSPDDLNEEEIDYAIENALTLEQIEAPETTHWRRET